MKPYYRLADFLWEERMSRRQEKPFFVPKRSQKIKNKRREKGKKK